ncbi:MAG: hypothetical protein ACXWKP_05255 [Bradyrhizobium sp.]
MVHSSENWKNSFQMTSQAMLPASPLRPRYLIMALNAVIVMIVAIIGPSDWFLNWVHVMFGTLWTGIDLFMGFVVGPVLRTLPLETRRAVLNGLIPRTLVLMPTLSIVTGTAGWFLAKRLGYFEIGYPEFYWVVAALAILTVLTLQGLGILLPTNLWVYFELQKPAPNLARIGVMMQRLFRVVAIQGTMQVAMIVVMARFATGL